MNKKLYFREGRRFVQIQDCTGMYYNRDGSFSKEKTNTSIGLCVLQTPTKRIIYQLNDNPPRMSYEKAKKYCKTQFEGNGILPAIDILYYAYTKFRNIFPKRGFMWSSTGYNSYGARCLDLFTGYVYIDTKDTSGIVFAFLELDI